METLIIAIAAGLIVLFVGWVCKEAIARWRAGKAVTEQPEKWKQLREGLGQCSAVLSALTSRLTPNPIDTSRPNVAVELEVIRDRVPDLDELRKTANGLSHSGLRAKVADALGSAEVWKSAIDHAWRQVENLEGRTIDSRDRREEALHWFSIERHAVYVKHEEYLTPIREGIDAIHAVERRESLAKPPGDNVLRRAARRVGAYFNKLGTIN